MITIGRCYQILKINAALPRTCSTEKKAGRLIFRGDQFLQCWKLGGVACSWVGEGLLLGRTCDCRGHAQGSQSHPSCPSPLPLSSKKTCPLSIDWRGLAGDFTCLLFQKELVSLSLQKSPASNMGKRTRASPGS